MTDTTAPAPPRRAWDELRAAIADRRADDALAPIVVLCSNRVSARIVHVTLGRVGSVNVHAVALSDLPEHLGRPGGGATEDGTKELTSAVLSGAVRVALGGSPTAGTVAAFVKATRDLASASDDQLEHLAGHNNRTHRVVEVVRRTRALTTGYSDGTERWPTSTDEIAQAPQVITFLLGDLRPHQAATISALDPAGKLIQVRRPEVVPVAPTPTATRIASVPDPTEEAHYALRTIRDRAAAGVPLHAIAVASPSTTALARVAGVLAANGIPHRAPATRTLADTSAGRIAKGLLTLTTDLELPAIVDWFSSSPVAERDGLAGVVPGNEWEQLARSAYIVRGYSQWTERLSTLIEDQARERDAATRGDASDPKIRALDSEIEHAHRLRSFIDELNATLLERPAAPSDELAGWLASKLERYLPASNPPSETDLDKATIVDAIRQLAQATSPLQGQLATDALAGEALSRALPATGRIGTGVLVAPLADSACADLDTTIVIGLAEGSFPRLRRRDALLTDAERTATDPTIPHLARSAKALRDDFHMALAAAQSERILVCARLDERGERRRQPSRQVLDAASVLAGRPIAAAELERLGAEPWCDVVVSPEGAVKAPGIRTNDREDLLRELANTPPSELHEHQWMRDNPVVARGIECARARRTGGVSRWLGFTGADSVTFTRALSASALEALAACPFKFFLRRVVNLAEDERARDEFDALDPAKLGTLIHKALEEFLTPYLPSGPLATPTTWSPSDRVRLAELGRARCDELEKAGIVRNSVRWRAQRADILVLLDKALDQDERRRDLTKARPVALEWSFGEASRFAVTLPSGREVAIRGTVDRIDRVGILRSDRTFLYDYKTGRKPWRKDQVTGRGEALQGVIYAMAALDHVYPDEPQTCAMYWYLNSDQYAGFAFGKQERQRALSVIDDLVGMIDSGLFPARPGPSNDDDSNCNRCGYDRICPSKRQRVRTWQRVSDPVRRAGAPGAFDAYVELADGPLPDWLENYGK